MCCFHINPIRLCGRGIVSRVFWHSGAICCILGGERMRFMADGGHALTFYCYNSAFVSDGLRLTCSTPFFPLWLKNNNTQ